MLQTRETLAAAIGVPLEDAANLLNVCTVSGEPGQSVLAELCWLPVNEEPPFDVLAQVGPQLIAEPSP